ncbi:hypothetical protein B0T10DRAFT_455790 [Thelonectria olida]|uniref:RBR-type E3 ubiquitin transferase n=1 Tax=Thelonectria olida TaxID=1576542 RepID=A0A9P9ATS9_9HYPO|nr:hypothetical protein B0T10DRAFT_455790 [Thelonectria olida]
MHQVPYRGEGRIPRPRHYREDDREWYPPDDVWPYSLPHRSHMREVQRPDDRAPRGYERGPRNSRSLEQFHHNMPPPHLTRGATDPYTRRPREILVYQDEDDEPPDQWRHPRTRETTPEFERPTRRARREHRRRPPPLPEPPSSESPPSDSESEDESSESDNEIEVVEFRDEESEYHHRQHRRHRDRHLQQSSDQYSSSEDPRRRRSSRRRPASPSDSEIEVQYRRGRREIVEPPVTPSQLRRGESESPKYDPQSRVTSVIESSRPPVASRRLAAGELVLQSPPSDPRVRTIKIYDAQGAQFRHGRSPSANTTLQQSRSSSRRPPSLRGSNLGSSSRMSSPERPARLRDCTACLSEVPQSRCPKLECGHRKCHTCLKRSFEQSLSDPQHMPPACCDTPIQLQVVDDLFDWSFKKKWNRKFAEYSSQDRIVCPSNRCGEWISPDSIHRDRISGRMIGQCDRCNERVCIACKSRWHYPRKCRQDEDSRNEESWSSCYKCDSVAKPKEGRLKMHCRCGAKYCIVCGDKWKSCDCQWFSKDMEAAEPEDRLVQAPKHRRGREKGHDRGDPPSPGELRAGRGLPDIRPQPNSYEEEMMLQQLQDRREERRSQYISEGEWEPMTGPGDLVPVRNAPAPAPPPVSGPPPGHYMQDPYGNTMGPPPVPGPPPPAPDGRSSMGRSSLEQSPRVDYAGRSRRGQSMDRRLADRFSETRQVPGSMPGMEPPRSHHLGSPLMPPPMSYSGGRVIVEHDPNEYRGDDSGSHFSHSSQSRRSKPQRRARRREKGERDEPKPSILAGLAGRGTGMRRVDVWRKYVEPGDFDGEIAAGAVVAAQG